MVLVTAPTISGELAPCPTWYHFLNLYLHRKLEILHISSPTSPKDLLKIWYVLIKMHTKA